MLFFTPEEVKMLRKMPMDGADYAALFFIGIGIAVILGFMIACGLLFFGDIIKQII